MEPTLEEMINPVSKLKAVMASRREPDFPESVAKVKSIANRLLEAVNGIEKAEENRRANGLKVGDSVTNITMPRDDKQVHGWIAALNGGVAHVMWDDGHVSEVGVINLIPAGALKGIDKYEPIPVEVGSEVRVMSGLYISSTGKVVQIRPDAVRVEINGLGGQIVELRPEQVKVIKEVVSVICPKCSERFDYLSVQEKGMGYVECPKCKALLNQFGKDVTPVTSSDSPKLYPEQGNEPFLNPAQDKCPASHPHLMMGKCFKTAEAARAYEQEQYKAAAAMELLVASVFSSEPVIEDVFGGDKHV